MQVSKYNGPTPEAFRGFLAGVQNLKEYLADNKGDKLRSAEEELSKSLDLHPDYAPAKYFKAIVLTHGRKANEAITLLEELSESNARFRAEVLYNLAFAYARTYKYEKLQAALDLLDRADRSAHRRFAGVSLGTKRLDLVLLIKAMKAWVMSILGGRSCEHREDFEERKLKYLPAAAKKALSVLADPRLKLLPSDPRTAIKVEALNAAGIAFMRMGQFGELFQPEATNKIRAKFTAKSVNFTGKSREEYWTLSSQHFDSALELHPTDVRVLDNLSTLNLIKASYAFISRDKTKARQFSEIAKERAQESISNNPYDRFRHYNLAKALALLDDWQAAKVSLAEVKKVSGVLSDKQADTFEEKVISLKDKRPILKDYFDALPENLTAEELRN
jgi:tetratricopeptide (TPR) repeat protein